MGLLDTLKRFVPIFGATSGAGREMLTGVYSSGNGEPPARGTREFLESYETNPWVRSIAGRVAGEVAKTKWQLTRSDRGEPVKQHLMLQTLRRPNSLMSGRGLFRVTQLSLDLVGDAFWLKQRNKFGAPVELWPIPPHWIVETPTPKMPRFRVAWRSWQAEIPETEVVWIHDPTPGNPYVRGSGVVRALGDEIETDEYAAKHAKQLFYNRAMPDFVVQDEGASNEELERHERAWSNKLQGLFRAFKPYFVNRKLEFWQPQQMNMENLTLVQLRKHERDIQLQCWGMPPEQLGIIENSNRATIEASDFVFQSRLIEPRRDFLAEELTYRLAAEYDARLVLGYESTVPADKAYQLDVGKAAPYTYTVNEWRALVGLAPVDDGDVRAVPLQYYMTDDLSDPAQRPQSGGGRPAAEPPEPEGEPEMEPEPAA